ncbi:MAG: oxidase [Fimbriimonadia bacterium]|nr:oxidase [Fimbriimonadia bacterium]
MAKSHSTGGHHDAAGHHDGGHAHVIPSVGFYFWTLLVLMVLLVLTVWAGYWKVSVSAGIVIALTIAVVKAVIVISNFMNVKFGTKQVWLWAGAGFFWLIILFAYAFADYVSRDHWMKYPGWEQTISERVTSEVSGEAKEEGSH